MTNISLHTPSVLTDLLAVRDIRLGDEDILDQLVVLLLLPGEHEAAGLQEVGHAVQLEHCESKVLPGEPADQDWAGTTRPQVGQSSSRHHGLSFQPIRASAATTNQSQLSILWATFSHSERDDHLGSSNKVSSLYDIDI